MPKEENDSNHLFFQSLKEDRKWYFVDYHPPIHNHKFATLQIIFLNKEKGLEEIAESMEAESVIWLERYPIPIMISAFDDKGDLIILKEIRGCDHLIGFIDKQTHKVVREWRLLPNEELPSDAFDTSYLRKIYSEIPFRTKQQIKDEAKQNTKHRQLGWWIVFIWAVVVPTGIAILEWWSDWLGIVVLLYSLWKAIENTLRLMGKWQKSKFEIEKDAEQTKMIHHHYHCERNPEGFNRLKAENFERWQREELHKEAMSIKQSVNQSANDN